MYVEQVAKSYVPKAESPLLNKVRKAMKIKFTAISLNKTGKLEDPIEEYDQNPYY